MSDKRGLQPFIRDANQDALEWLEKLTADYPREPQCGDYYADIDYTGQVDRPIITCVICHGEELLLIHRREDGGLRNVWGLFGGLWMRGEPTDAVMAALRVEVGIKREDIATLTVAKRRLRLDPEHHNGDGVYNQRLHEFRMFVTLRRKVIPNVDWGDREAWWMPITVVHRLLMLPAPRRTLLAWLRICNSPLV